MGTKLTPALMRAAKRMRAEQKTYQEIADELSKRGVTVSKTAVINWLRGDVDVPKPERRAAAPAPVVVPPPPTPAATDGDEDERNEMSPDELGVWLTRQIREAQDSANMAKMAGDISGQARAMRLAGQLATLLDRQHARQGDDGDVIRLKQGDMEAASDRALAMLDKTAEAVLAVVATWPKCDACGTHVGQFSETTDRSLVRAAFERVARRGA